MASHACIVGIGETEYYGKPGGGKSTLTLMLDASMRAIADAGLAPADIDGIMPFYRSISAEELAANLGCRNLTFAATVNMGGAGSVAGSGSCASASVARLSKQTPQITRAIALSLECSVL